MMLWKCCTQYVSKFRKLSSSHGTGKGQFSFQSQRRAMPKCIQTTLKITLISQANKVMLLCSKSFKLGFNSTWTKNFQMFKLDLEKAEEPSSANIQWIIEKAREFQKNICFMDYTKAFDCVDHNKLWKVLRDGNTRPPHPSPEKPVCKSRSNS